jgi:hypothetical protein
VLSVSVAHVVEIVGGRGVVGADIEVGAKLTGDDEVTEESVVEDGVRGGGTTTGRAEGVTEERVAEDGVREEETTTGRAEGVTEE